MIPGPGLSGNIMKTRAKSHRHLFHTWATITNKGGHCMAMIVSKVCYELSNLIYKWGDVAMYCSQLWDLLNCRKFVGVVKFFLKFRLFV